MLKFVKCILAKSLYKNDKINVIEDQCITNITSFLSVVKNETCILCVFYAISNYCFNCRNKE